MGGVVTFPVLCTGGETKKPTFDQVHLNEKTNNVDPPLHFCQIIFSNKDFV